MSRFKFWRRDGDTSSGDAPEAPEPQTGLLTGDPARDAQSLEILLDSIAEVNATIDLDRVLVEIVSKSLAVTQAERAILLLGEKGQQGLSIRVARDKQGTDLGTDVQYSRSLVRKVIDEVQPIRNVVQSDEQALELGQSVFDLKLRAVMCVPLQANNRTIGAIYVDSKARRREFSDRDLALFGALSAQLALAIENARLYADSLEKVRLEGEVQIARRIQQHLVPSVPEGLVGLDLAVRYRAAEHASGDIYDFVAMPGGRLAILVGDVTGHGIGAALLTHAAQAALRSYLELVDDASDVVSRLNARLAESVETGNFMSLLLVIVDPAEGQAHYVNAGHPGLIAGREDGIQVLGKTGMVLGVVGEQRYSQSEPVQLSVGDFLLLRTDGVDETMDSSRQPFGEDRIKAIVERSRGQSAEQLMSSIDQELRAFSGGAAQEDDVTMIALRITER